MNCIRSKNPVLLLGKLFNRVHVSNVWKHADKVSIQHVRKYSSVVHEEETENKGEYELEDPKSEAEVVNVVYITKEGNRLPIRAKIGDNILFLAHRHKIELEGACGGALACSTCHVYIQPEYIDKLIPSDASEDDMLDTASDVTEYSRLGCQINLTKEMEGMEITMPIVTRNFYVDGHVPKPH